MSVKSKAAYYWKVVEKTYKTQCVYRIQVISKIIYSVLLYSIQMYIWRSVGANAAGMSDEFGGMQTYIVISSIIGVFISFDSNVIPVIGERIRTGKIGLELTKPHNFCIYIFSEYLGKSIFKLLYSAVPLMILFAVINRGRLALRAEYMLPFAVSLILAMLLFFGLCICMGMLSFWLVTIGNLHIILDSMITLFSGSVIPLWLIPTRLVVVYNCLPFKYLFYDPISICMGNTSFSEIVDIYVGQTIWIFIFFMLAFVIYRKGYRHIQHFGG